MVDLPLRIKGENARWRTVLELVADKAETHGDKPFIEIDGRGLSYRDLDRQSDRLAEILHTAGITKGARVASLMYNCPEQATCWIAANKLGAIWTPLNAGLIGRDLAYTLSDSGAAILFVDDETAGKVDSLDTGLRDRIKVISVGVEARPGLDLLSELSAATPRTVLPDIPLAPSDPAMIIYTGGTTGLPKGVVLPHFSLVCVGYRYRETFDVTASDRYFTTLPLFHAAAIQFAFLGPLANDMTSVIDRRFSVNTYWTRVRQTKATMIDPISTTMTLLCQQPETPQDREHCVRVGVGITAQVPTWVPIEFTRRFGIPLVSVYGLTEAGGAMITGDRLGRQVDGSNGKAYGWAGIMIADKNGQEVPPGDLGEILLRPTVPNMFMIGYWNNPGRTVECFRDLWLHTGDLGRVDADGNLFFVGREAHWMRRRGENISAYEIESIVSQHPNVKEVICVGVPAELGEEDVKAFIIPKEAGGLDPAELIEWCRGRMAAFKIPRFIEFVDSFERSATKGEVERAKLKARPNESAWDREKVTGHISSQSKVARLR